jgi:FMN reductase
MSITIVVGNPSANSRTRQVALEVAQRLSEAVGSPVGTCVDLADHASSLFDWKDPVVGALSDLVRQSRYVVVATPTYKGTYTGLLKAFLDRFDADELTGVVAIPVMTMGSPAHSLAVDVFLRPLLVELGLSLPTRGVVLQMSRYETRESEISAWAETQLPLLDRNHQ